MAESLLFKEVRINRMYGADFDLRLSNLSAHLNIVFGPNGAGKTTIANALNGLLLPGAGREVRLYAEAHLSFGNRTLDLNLKDTRAECRIDTKTVDRSELSRFLRPKSHHLSLQELLPGKDKDLALEIIRQANGGFDIAAAGKNLNFARKQRYQKRNETSEFTTASYKLNSVLNEQRSLQQRKKQRANILDELDAARQAAEREILIEKIQKWRSAEADHKKAIAVANTFPRVIQSGYDLANAVAKTQELAQSINQLERSIAQRSGTIERIQESLAQNRLSPNGLRPGDLKLLIAQVRDCSEKHRELEKLQETQQASKELAQNAWENLGGYLQQGWEPRFTREDLKHLQEYAKDLDSHTQKKKALEELRILLGMMHDGDSTIDTHEILNAQQTILQWMRDLQNDSLQRQRLRTLLLITIIKSTLISLIAGIALHPIGYTGLVISALTSWIYMLLRFKKQRQISPTQKDELKSLLPELPQKPDINALQSGLDQLFKKHSTARLQDLTSNELSRIEQQLKDLLKRQPEFEIRKEELMNSLHLTPPSDITSLIALVDDILAWRKMDLKEKEETSRLKRVSESYADFLKKTGNTFEKYGYKAPADPYNAERMLEEIRQDDDASKRAYARLEQEKKGLEAIKSHLKDEKTQYEKVFTDLKLNKGDLSGLADYARQFAEWEKACFHANERKTRSETLRPHQDVPDEHKSLLEIEDLGEALLSARQESTKEKDLQERLTRLDADIERAESSHSLENALAEQETKRIALESVREKEAAKAVGQAILEHLRESAIKNAPPVFQRAQENFQRVTDNRYTLIIPQDGKFRTTDNQRKRVFDLTELSSATRVQLLLSVRLAFVETQESKYRLPITLDETLANSDDERARAIIKTISTLAADRQVFYFTAQKDEVDKWRDFVPEDLLQVHSIG